MTTGASIAEAIGRFFAVWKFWLVVPPWDVGIRVRLGRHAKRLPPGLHLRIPFIDEITLVNTRLRTTTTPPSTRASPMSGCVRVVQMVIGYRVVDPLAAVLTLAEPRSAVMAHAQRFSDVDPDACRAAMQEALVDCGIIVDFVRYTQDVDVPAMRLLQGDWGIYDENAGAAVAGATRY